MLRVAVCDNEEPELKRLEEGLKAYADQSEEPVEWVSFHDPQKLKESLEGGASFDVALLDILMPEVSGIELGKYIREYCSNLWIIYITSSPDFALQAYENHALRYLMKPVDQKELFSALDFTKGLQSQKKDPVMIKSTTGMVTTTPDQVILVENVGRCVQYHLADGRKVRTVSRRSRLDELVAPLPERPEFIKPHNSFWINMNYITEMRREELVMEHGVIVPISRGRQQEVKRAYLKFPENLSERGRV